MCGVLLWGSGLKIWRCWESPKKQTKKKVGKKIPENSHYVPEEKESNVLFIHWNVAQQWKQTIVTYNIRDESHKHEIKLKKYETNF